MTKLTAISRADAQSVFTFTRDEDFYVSFRSLLLDLGFEEWDIPDSWTALSPQTDSHHQIGNDALLLHVVVGAEKIFVIATGPSLETFNQRVTSTFTF